MANKKQKVVVWMSRDTKETNYEFWSKRPRTRSSRQYYDKAKPRTPRLSFTRLASACSSHPERILAPIKLNKHGLYKLTIIAERIE